MSGKVLRSHMTSGLYRFLEGLHEGSTASYLAAGFKVEGARSGVRAPSGFIRFAYPVK